MNSTTHIQIILDIMYGDETPGCAVSGTSRKDMLPKGERSVASSDYFGKSNARALKVIYKRRMVCVSSTVKCRSGSLGVRKEVVYSVSMKQGIVIGIGGTMALVALGLLNLTTPDEVGPLGVLAFFVCIYIAIVCGLYLLLLGIYRGLCRIMRSSARKAWSEQESKMKLYYYASVLALAPVILLGMQSVGEVKALDVGLLILFELLACFYIAKRF